MLAHTLASFIHSTTSTITQAGLKYRLLFVPCTYHCGLLLVNESGCIAYRQTKPGLEDTESLRLLPFFNVICADKGMFLSQLFHWIVITAIYNDFEWKASTHYDLTMPYGFFDTRNVHRNIIICTLLTSTHSWVNGWMLINVYRKVQPPTLEKAASGNSPRDKGTDHGSIYVPIYVPFNPPRIFL